MFGISNMEGTKVDEKEKEKKYRILIVDDQKRDIEFLENVLNQENFELSVAKNGKETFAIVEKEEFDLIILDVILPDIDGYDICRKIKEKEQFSNVPVLFYTNINTVENKLIGLKMGASDFLVKNSDPRELLIRVQILLETKKSLDSAVALSFMDSLTDIYNRRYFQYFLKNEFARSFRYKRDFSCAIIDLDKFKRINDKFGHQKGDAVLQKTASILMRNIRNSDIACRYGGDEFAILFPETDSAGAYNAVERIRECVLEEEKDQDYAMTVSCGISSFSETTKKFDDLVERADKALYAAKQKGRNQTKVFVLNKVCKNEFCQKNSIFIF